MEQAVGTGGMPAGLDMEQAVGTGGGTGGQQGRTEQAQAGVTGTHSPEASEADRLQIETPSVVLAEGPILPRSFSILAYHQTGTVST